MRTKVKTIQFANYVSKSTLVNIQESEKNKQKTCHNNLFNIAVRAQIAVNFFLISQIGVPCNVIVYLSLEYREKLNFKKLNSHKVNFLNQVSAKYQTFNIDVTFQVIVLFFVYMQAYRKSTDPMKMATKMIGYNVITVTIGITQIAPKLSGQDQILMHSFGIATKENIYCVIELKIKKSVVPSLC